jgi:hypothetical protein
MTAEKRDERLEETSIIIDSFAKENGVTKRYKLVKKSPCVKKSSHLFIPFRTSRSM